MTKLLISIRSAEEAALIRGYPVDIIDLKDPSRGALGAVDTFLSQQILGELPQSQIKSIALGELSDRIRSAESAAIEAISDYDFSCFHYAKIGLAGMGLVTDWQERWLDIKSSLPSSVRLVGVAYADADHCSAPPAEAVMSLLISQADGMLLIDTFEKRHGNTIELFGLEKIQSIIQTAHAHGVRVVVAGSIREQHLPELLACNPDYIGVRGAVCTDGRSQLDSGRLKDFFANWCRLNP